MAAESAAVAARSGAVITGHSVDLYGRCPDCATPRQPLISTSIFERFCTISRPRIASTALAKFWGAKSCVYARFCLWKSSALGEVGEGGGAERGEAIADLETLGEAEGLEAADALLERGALLAESSRRAWRRARRVDRR